MTQAAWLYERRRQPSIDLRNNYRYPRLGQKDGLRISLIRVILLSTHVNDACLGGRISHQHGRDRARTSLTQSPQKLS